ncbi:putative ABC transport system permease protein [Dysgonomonas alginatilytica]|uniref:Putative ABC transport system permease protein n=1 Tax=Dysgonomonas alginatilytica TaxID=1605892 RepID=A0A2V3PTH3_9BACT|nr:ABC transporter permease [Dysgonomonas alginatilytica]PXV66788.1 putative ABC transport system permease protein [Dysgonomonas alginatilytica]
MRIADLKIYQKFLSRNKLYTLVSVVGFSVSLTFVILLGIYVKQELSVDSFHEKKDRIFLLAHDESSKFGNPVADFVKDKCPEVEAYTRIHPMSVVLGEKGQQKVKAEALFADSTFFNVFSFKLIEGNPSQVLSTLKSVVVTKSFANKMFSGKNPVGVHLIINNVEYTITGIMEDIPQNTQIPKADFVVNYASITQFFGGDWILTTPYNFGFTMYFLEKEGSDLPAKTPMLLELFKKEFWFYKDGFTQDLKFIPLKDAYFEINEPYSNLRTNSKTLISVYTGIVILILVIALLNYINMTVAQAGFRGKEAAMKKLLGCSRKSLMLQLLTESLLMTSFTFILGLFMAFLIEPSFNNLLNTDLNLSDQLSFTLICIATIFVLFISIVAGFIPAIIISGFNPIEIVKGSFSRKVKSKYSKLLIVFQYIVAIVLLICSFFIKQQSDFLVNYDTGFNRDRIFIMDNVLDSARLVGFKNILYTISGVELVSYSQGTPVSGSNNNSFEVDGVQFSFQELVVDSVFFKIFDIKISPTGIEPTNDTYWVNQKAFNALHPDSVSFMANFGNNNNQQIAGIVSDFNFKSLHEPMGLMRIRKLPAGHWVGDITVKITEGADLYKTADKIKDTYSKYNGGELFEARFANDILQKAYEKEEKTSQIISAFAILTILIMVMGVFAMSLYLIRQKEKEIGIRKVNGATEGEILRMLNMDSFIRVLIAFVFACPIAYYAMSRWLEGFAYKIDLSWWVFVVCGLIVLLLSLLSVSWQSLRAARANPVDSIKGE